MEKRGFTLLEIIIVLAAVSVGVVLFFMQMLNVDALKRDENRKTAINAMYFNLEEDFYMEHGYYPEEIGPDVLRAMDPNLFTDPIGMMLGTEGSSYRYEPSDCTDGECKHYVLRGMLEKEDTFTRQSRN